MITHLKGRSIAVVLAGFALIACGDEEATKQPLRSTKSQSSALWGCEVKGETVVCTAALSEAANAEGAYACKADDTVARCPDAKALQKVDGLDELLAKSGKGYFEALPWACLTTGAHQSHCTRDLSRRMQSLAGAGGGEDNGGAEAPEGPASPEIPQTCDVEAWEEYFAQLATYAYNANGVDIQFPRDIFDANGSMIGAAIGGAMSGNGGSMNAGQSCHDGEWQMRNQSWLDAVSVGCMQLNNAILVMCQQAAEYAPKAGKCTDTGSW